MPCNILPFSQRSDPARLPAPLTALFRSNLALLHSHDQNTRHYFGMARSELLERVGSEPAPGTSTDTHHPAVLRYQHNLAQLQSLPACLDAQPDESAFFWFEQRFHRYFTERFLKHPAYPQVADALHSTTVLEGLRPYVRNTVRRLSEPTLVHALNHRILADPSFTLDQFSEGLRAPARVADLASSYPVLFNLLFDTLEDITHYLFSVVRHYLADRPALRKCFACPLEQIDTIRLGLGDPHGRQQTVCEVTSAASSFIYKPRRNHEMRFYNESLALLRRRTGSDWFDCFSPRLLMGADHCWVEKIPHVPCQSHPQRALFYQRLGAQIALIHAFNGIDFHFENIIAHGCSPVMIDLECLFTAPLGATLNAAPLEGALASAQRMARESIFATGFVPYAQHALNDVSALSAQSQLAITRQTLVQDEGFYHMRKSSAQRQAPVQHQPFASTTDPTPYLPALREGFEFAYDAICRHRDALLEHLERNAAQLSTRILVKNTQRYVDFIALGLHPRFMQNQLDRELLLATLWSDAIDKPLHGAAFKAEVEDLQRLVIPRFELPINSCALGTAVGADTVLMLEHSPLQGCRHKIQSLGPADKKLQMAVFDQCLNRRQGAQCPLNAAHSGRHAAPLSPAQALQAAQRIAAQIEDLLITGEDQGARWLAFKTHTATGKPFLTVMGNDLYSGIAGLGLFFLGLYQVTADRRYLQRTDQILGSLADTRQAFGAGADSGGYQKLAGHLYLLWHRQALAPTQQYDQPLQRLQEQLCALPCDAFDIDFIAGSSGALALLSELHRCAPTAQLARAIDKRLEQISRTLYLGDNGQLLHRDGSTVLSGLAHGLSGVILALCKAYGATRDSRIVPMIEGYVSAENALKDQGFWLDLRECRQARHASKWCHGDAGILLARLAVRECLGAQLPPSLAEVVNHDIACCLDNLQAGGLNDGYTLCHGDFGNLMCLDRFHHAQGDQGAIKQVARLRGAALSDYLQDDALQCQAYPQLGLMTGISGVGYALLKHIDHSLPDVLSLAFTRPSGDLQW